MKQEKKQKMTEDQIDKELDKLSKRIVEIRKKNKKVIEEFKAYMQK